MLRIHRSINKYGLAMQLKRDESEHDLKLFFDIIHGLRKV
jgi:hypothetical protein